VEIQEQVITNNGVVKYMPKVINKDRLKGMILGQVQPFTQQDICMQMNKLGGSNAVVRQQYTI
jgi:hypothetical protein